MPKQLVRVDNTPGGVSRVTAAFDAFSATHQLPAPVVVAVHVALDELLSNTVRAGSQPGTATGEIEACFALVGGSLEVTLEDDGLAFDPLAQADPDTSAPLEARPVGGLGIYLVKQLMDQVHYERTGDKNRVRLVKRVEDAS